MSENQARGIANPCHWRDKKFHFPKTVKSVARDMNLASPQLRPNSTVSAPAKCHGTPPTFFISNGQSATGGVSTFYSYFLLSTFRSSSNEYRQMLQFCHRHHPLFGVIRYYLLSPSCLRANFGLHGYVAWISKKNGCIVLQTRLSFDNPGHTVLLKPSLSIWNWRMVLLE